MKKIFMMVIAFVVSAMTAYTVNAAETNVIIEDDFSQYQSGADIRKSYMNFALNGDYEHCDIVEDDSEHGKVLKMWKTADDDNFMIRRVTDKVYTAEDGIIEIKYDVKPSSQLTTMLWAYSTTGQSTLIAQFTPNGTIISAGGGTLLASNVEGGIWYTVDAKINLGEKKMNVKIVNASGDVICDKEAGANLDDFCRIGMQIWTKNSSESYFDNLLVKTTGETTKLPSSTQSIYKQNFEENTTGIVKRLNNATMTTVASGDEHGTAYQIGWASSQGWPRADIMFDAKTTGKFVYKISIKPTNQNITKIGYLNDQSNQWSVYTALHFDPNGNVYVGDGTSDAVKLYTNYSVDEWYDLYCILDLDAGTQELILVDAEGNVSKNKHSYSGCAMGAFIQIGGSKEGNSLFDDVEILYNATEIPYEFLSETEGASDNFESYESVADIKNWGFFQTSASNASIVTDSEKNSKVFGFSVGDVSWAWRNLDSTITKGKVKFTFDVKPDALITTFVQAIKQDNQPLPILFFEPGGDRIWSGAQSGDNALLGTYTANQWYNCEAVIDLDNQMMDVICVGNGKTMKKERIDISSTTSGVKGFGFQVWTQKEGTSYIDNVTIEHIIDNYGTKPALTQDSVSMYMGQTLQDAASVSAETNKIVIDFGAVLNPVLIEKTVKITDSNNVKVKFSGEYKRDKYIIRLDEKLQENEEYTLTVDKATEGADGQKLGTDFVMNFTTRESQNNIEFVTSDKGLTKIVFENPDSEDIELKLITAYYKNGALANMEIKPVTIPANSTGNYLDTGVVDAVDGIDSVKLMLLDDFVNLTPMCASVEIKNDEVKLVCDENGDFDILVVGDPQLEGRTHTFTDWIDAANNLEYLVETTNPDMVIIDGDVVGDSGWVSKELIGILVESIEERDIPWATTNGNHDMYSATDYSIYKNFENCVNERVSEDDVNAVATRRQNYMLPIYANDGKTPVFAVWGMDTGEYARDENGNAIGGWDTVTEKQIEWYKAKSAELTEKNNGTPLTGLLCCHIPFVQMTDAIENITNYKTYGYVVGNGSSGVETGMFDAIAEMGDIRAIINGHDHDSNMIVAYEKDGYELLMGYTGKIGSYGTERTDSRGGRLIKINQNAPENFTVSWIPALDGILQPEMHYDGTLAE